jgi:hypothetical protein
MLTYSVLCCGSDFEISILEKLIMNFVTLPLQVNLTHMVFGIFFLSGLVLFSTGVNLFNSEVSYLLLYNICFIVLF